MVPRFVRERLKSLPDICGRLGLQQFPTDVTPHGRQQTHQSLAVAPKLSLVGSGSSARPFPWASPLIRQIRRIACLIRPHAKSLSSPFFYKSVISYAWKFSRETSPLLENSVRAL